MVTFIVVLILILYAIFFTVLLILGKGRVLKRWIVTGLTLLVAGGICIGVAIPVTSNQYKDEISLYRSLLLKNSDFFYYCEENKEKLESELPEFVARNRAFYHKAQFALQWFYWDITPDVKEELDNLPWIWT